MLSVSMLYETSGILPFGSEAVSSSLSLCIAGGGGVSDSGGGVMSGSADSSSSVSVDSMKLTSNYSIHSMFTLKTIYHCGITGNTRDVMCIKISMVALYSSGNEFIHVHHTPDFNTVTP